MRLNVLFTCLVMCLSASANAQGTATVSTPPAVSAMTVYYAIYADAKSHVPIDDIKKFGFYQTVADPAISSQLLDLLAQNQRPDLTPGPPVNGLFYIEQGTPSSSYLVSPAGVVWSGTHCYQLSRDDRQSVGDIIRHQVFTREFWKNSAHLGKAAKIDDVDTWDQVNASSLNGKPIIVSFIVDEHGKALNPHVTQSCGNDELDEDACDVVRHQKFSPVMENGEPKRAYFAHTFVVGN